MGCLKPRFHFQECTHDEVIDVSFKKKKYHVRIKCVDTKRLTHQYTDFAPERKCFQKSKGRPVTTYGQTQYTQNKSFYHVSKI